MNLKNFLKPNKRKVILFILLFLLFPYPQFRCNGGCHWVFSPFAPLIAPLEFGVSILQLIFGPEFHSLDHYILFFLGLFSPLLLYLLSCFIILIYERLRSKK